VDELNDTITLPETTERRSLAKWLKPALGYLPAVAGLIWVLRDIHPAKLREGLTGINWRLIALALVCDAMSYVCQGWRWRLLLRPVGEISTLRSTQAIYAGLFTSEALPMRVGELTRAWLVSRRLSAKFLAVIPSIVVERLSDGVWLAIGIGLTASFALSLIFILLQALAYWLIMLGYGLRLSFWIGVAVFLIVHLGTAIPNAPANVGSYQFFTVLGLTLFGVDKTRAAGFSLVVFALLTLPLLVIGFIAQPQRNDTGRNSPRD
jgi:uncharacterized membrane protein YbhN (UPF0104 family)